MVDLISFLTSFQPLKPADKKRICDKRNTYIVDDVTPTKDNVDFLKDIDKRKTFIMDSDTNSTTNGSSPRNSSIFSHERLTTGASESEGESGTESAPVVRRREGRENKQAQAKQRYVY